jgi:hypothetical protein
MAGYVKSRMKPLMEHRSVQSKPTLGLLLYSLSKFTSTLKEAVHSSGTLVPIYKTTVFPTQKTMHH